LAAALLCSLTVTGIAGLDAPSVAAAPRPQPVATLPETPGPHVPREAEYDLGSQSFVPPSLGSAVETKGVVYYPQDLGAGPFPIVMLLHGMHAYCTLGTDFPSSPPVDGATPTSVPTVGFDPSQLSAWPCDSSVQSTPIPNYQGYAYLGRHLASRGFIVVSVSANGVNAFDGAQEQGMKARAELLHRHFELWWGWTHGARFPGVDFSGAVDWSKIGTMGHSRGGEGVVYHALLEAELDSAFQPDAVIPLAPVDFFRKQLTGTDFGVILPACDGDVSDLQGVQFFDDARYLHEPTDRNRFSMTLDGANHNFFNTVWSPSSGIEGSSDDGAWVSAPAQGDSEGCSPAPAGRLSEETQRLAGLIYMTAFFEGVLRDDRQLDLWRSTVSKPSYPFVAQTTWQPPSKSRVDLNRVDSADRLVTNTLGGEVRQTSIAFRDFCGLATPLQSCTAVPEGAPPSQAQRPQLAEPHLAGLTAGDQQFGLGQERIIWTGRKGSVAESIPLGDRDLRSSQSLRFRLTPNPSVADMAPGVPTNLSVRFSDAKGTVVQIPVSQIGARALRNPNRRLHLQQVRVPLAPVAKAGIDLSQLAAVTLVFDKTDSGAVDVADIMFVSEARTIEPNGALVEIIVGPPIVPPLPPAPPTPGRPDYTG
jgi:hypothetical protein